MDAKRAFVAGQRLGLAKIASVNRALYPGLVKLAKVLNALERRGKLTKKAADVAFAKAAQGAAANIPQQWWQYVPGMAGIGNILGGIGRGLKGFWGGFTGTGAGGQAAPGAAGAAAPGAAGAAAPGAAGGLPGGFGAATPQQMLQESQMMHGLSPQQMDVRNRAQQALMNRMNRARMAAAQSRALYAL